MNEKIVIQPFKKSIRDSRYTAAQVSVIWDFYVTHSIAESAGQKRSSLDYGYKQLPFTEMLKIAKLDKNNCVILPCDNINKTLCNFGLMINEKIKDENGKSISVDKAIDISKPRAVCIAPYSINDDEAPKPKKGKAENILTHIRNAFAHGNTYFLDNDMVLLEDKNNNRITAEILIHMKTLLDWIKTIDKDKRFYSIQELEFTQKAEE